MTATRVGSARIVGTAVAPLVPATGPVRVLVVGEAPGPRGADKSGVPFFGDAAGRALYAVLAELGAVRLPERVAMLPWDGAAFAAEALVPEAHGVALGNAWDRCPTDDGQRFRAPTRRELASAENAARIAAELDALRARGLRGVVTLGRVAAQVMARALERSAFAALRLEAVVHPSAQGLLSMAPDRGRGARMADLEAEWRRRCRTAIVAAGYVPPTTHAGVAEAT